MSGRRKSSKPPTGVADSKVERKRVQNRIAQQHAREKQIARVRELESFVDRIKSAVDEDDAGSDETSLTARNTKLKKAFLEVLDENAKLKQGLLRLRKNMVTLSTQAADGAGDAIYDEIIAKAEDRESSQITNSPAHSNTTYSELQDSAFQPSLAHLDGFHGEHNNNSTWDGILGHDESALPDITSVANRLALDRTSYDSRPCLDAFSFSATDAFLPRPVNVPSQPLDPSMQSLETHIAEEPYNPGSHISFHEKMAHEILFRSNHSHLQSLRRDESPLFQLYPHRPAALGDIFQTMDQPSVSSVTTGQAARSSSVFEILEHVLSIYISQMEQLTDATWKTLLAAAVRLLFSWTRLEEYAHCLGLGNLHESIVRWRLEPTPTNRKAIRPPFRPTDLQSVIINTTRYSPWLDFIPWPEFRDQVLFRKDILDPADVLQDILDNIVLELPHLGVAVLISALFLATRKKIVTADVQDRQEGSVANISGEAVDASMFIRTNFTPEELSAQPAAAIAQIKKEMDADGGVAGRQAGGYAAATGSDGNLNTALLRELQAEFTEKYRVEDTERWKLRPAMGVKYPFMRISSLQTKFPVISASLLVGC